MPTQLPSGNWRPRIRHPRTGKQLNPQTVIGGPSSYRDERAARAAEREALKVLRTNARAGMTVREWWEEWTTDPLWLRPAESTNLLNRERAATCCSQIRDRTLRIDYRAAGLSRPDPRYRGQLRTAEVPKTH